jgi:hypothetical protein
MHLELSIFCADLNGGCAIGTIPETLKITRPNALRPAQVADDMQFEAPVPVGHCKGFGVTAAQAGGIALNRAYGVK